MQKFVNLVDLVKSFLTSIYLHMLASSTQPRTSLSKFGGDSIDFFIRLLTHDTTSNTGQDKMARCPASDFTVAGFIMISKMWSELASGTAGSAASSEVNAPR